jgi:hypothetical protein
MLKTFITPLKKILNKVRAVAAATIARAAVYSVETSARHCPLPWRIRQQRAQHASSRVPLWG